MLKKAILAILLGMLVALLTGCASDGSGTKLFSSKAPTVTLEEQMTLYKTTDVDGPILGTANAGLYTVLESKSGENDRGIWVKIKVNGKEGWVFGVLVKK